MRETRRYPFLGGSLEITWETTSAGAEVVSDLRCFSESMEEKDCRKEKRTDAEEKEESRKKSSEGEERSFPDQVYVQMQEYARGVRRTFDFPYVVHGTKFQKAVWEEVRRIPYGETRSYREIAEKIGKPGAARAVGMANHRNPLNILIPCHRVVGSDGKLTGYAGGLRMKRVLLALEAGNSPV